MEDSKRRRSTLRLFRFSVTTVSTVTLVTTQFFGTFPANPISATFQQVFAENLPAPMVAGFNQFTSNFNSPEISSNPETSPPGIDPIGLIESLISSGPNPDGASPQVAFGIDPVGLIESWLNGSDSHPGDIPGDTSTPPRSGGVDFVGLIETVAFGPSGAGTAPLTQPGFDLVGLIESWLDGTAGISDATHSNQYTRGVDFVGLVESWITSLDNQTAQEPPPPTVDPAAVQTVVAILLENASPTDPPPLPATEEPVPTEATVPVITEPPLLPPPPPVSVVQPGGSSQGGRTQLTPLTPSPTPAPDGSCDYAKSSTYAADCVISNMMMNGNAANTITVTSGTIVDMDFGIQAWSSNYCPGCKQQIVVGLDAQRTCIMDTVPGIYPGVSAPASTNNSITAPAAPGTYAVYMDYLTEADCPSALTAYTGRGPSVAQITTCGPVSARLYMGRLGYAGPDTSYQVLASTANDTVFYSVTGQNEDFGTLYYEIYVAPTLTFWIAETDIIEFQGDPSACVPYKAPPAVLSCGGPGSGDPAGTGCEITNIKLDGISQSSLTIFPSSPSTFMMEFDYQVWNTICPTCNLDIHPGAEWNFANACETVNNAGAYPGTSGTSTTFTLTAPTSPGNWVIFASMSSGASCDSSNYLEYGTRIGNVIVSPIVLYEAGGLYDGNLGGRAGADAYCQANLPPGYSNARAFIGVDIGDDMQSMPANYGIPTNLPITSTNGTLLANDLADLFYYGTLHGNSLTSAGVTTNNWWSGVDWTGVTSATSELCGNWTDNQPTSWGDTGSATETAVWQTGGPIHNWLYDWPVTCDSARALLCVAYP